MNFVPFAALLEKPFCSVTLRKIICYIISFIALILSKLLCIQISSMLFNVICYYQWSDIWVFLFIPKVQFSRELLWKYGSDIFYFSSRDAAGMARHVFIFRRRFWFAVKLKCLTMTSNMITECQYCVLTIEHLWLLLTKYNHHIYKYIYIIYICIIMVIYI